MDAEAMDKATDAIFRALCADFRKRREAAELSQEELCTRTGLSEDLVTAALRQLSGGPSGGQNLQIRFVDRDKNRIALGTSWRGRCEDARMIAAVYASISTRKRRDDNAKYLEAEHNGA